MNNTNTKNLALAAILAAVLIVVGTFVALQPQMLSMKYTLILPQQYV